METYIDQFWSRLSAAQMNYDNASIPDGETADAIKNLIAAVQSLGLHIQAKEKMAEGG